jgi:hypothetical protein
MFCVGLVTIGVKDAEKLETMEGLVNMIEKVRYYTSICNKFSYFRYQIAPYRCLATHHLHPVSRFVASRTVQIWFGRHKR